MAIPTAGDIMDKAATYLNDVNKTVYTYIVLFPLLETALEDLSNEFQLANVPVTNKASALINVPEGTIAVGFDTIPALPSDLITIQELWERAEGVNPYYPVPRKEFIPIDLEGTTLNSFGLYAWQGNEIKLPTVTGDRDLKIDYVRALFTAVSDENSSLGIINGKNYLGYRTAALAASLIGENPTRAEELNNLAAYSLGLLLSIDAKSKQGVSTRRRPFRRGYKALGR